MTIQSRVYRFVASKEILAPLHRQSSFEQFFSENIWHFENKHERRYFYFDNQMMLKKLDFPLTMKDTVMKEPLDSYLHALLEANNRAIK